MSFFKKYNGTTHKGLARLETLIWALIYGGLLGALIGLFMGRGGDASGETLMIGGGIVTAIGVVLILVRSRMHEDE